MVEVFLLWELTNLFYTNDMGLYRDDYLTSLVIPTGGSWIKPEKDFINFFKAHDLSTEVIFTVRDIDIYDFNLSDVINKLYNLLSLNMVNQKFCNIFVSAIFTVCMSRHQCIFSWARFPLLVYVSSITVADALTRCALHYTVSNFKSRTVIVKFMNLCFSRSNWVITPLKKRKKMLGKK